MPSLLKDSSISPYTGTLQVSVLKIESQINKADPVKFAAISDGIHKKNKWTTHLFNKRLSRKARTFNGKTEGSTFSKFI